jgi:hypothetical protein
MTQQSEEPVIAEDDYSLAYPGGDHFARLGSSEESEGRAGVVLAAVAAALSAGALIIMAILLFNDGVNSAWPLVVVAAALLGALLALGVRRQQSL